MSRTHWGFSVRYVGCISDVTGVRGRLVGVVVPVAGSALPCDRDEGCGSGHSGAEGACEAPTAAGK